MHNPYTAAFILFASIMGAYSIGFISCLLFGKNKPIQPTQTTGVMPRKALLIKFIGNMRDTEDFIYINKKINKYESDHIDDPDIADHAKELRELLETRSKKLLH